MYDKGEGVINQLPIIILLNVDIFYQMLSSF